MQAIGGLRTNHPDRLRPDLPTPETCLLRPDHLKPDLLTPDTRQPKTELS